MPTSTLDDYRQRVAGLPDDQVLGSILWFTVNRPRKTIEEMRQWFIELGLDERFLPNPIKAVDAFRAATGDESHIKRPEYDLTEDLHAKLRWEDAGYDNETVERHLYRVVRDSRNRQVQHEKIGEAVFYRPSKGSKAGGEKVRFTGQWTKLSDTETKKVEDYINRTHEEYKLLCQFPRANAVRATFRNYIMSLNSIAVRASGGVYFVHKSRQSTVDSLQEVASRLQNGSTLHTLPLVDTDEQRGMLADSFQEEVKDACEALLKDVAELNAKYGKGKIPPKEYSKANSAYQDLQQRAREYTDILELGMGDAALALETALDSVMDLATRIDHSGK